MPVSLAHSLDGICHELTCLLGRLSSPWIAFAGCIRKNSKAKGLEISAVKHPELVARFRFAMAYAYLVLLQ